MRERGPGTQVKHTREGWWERVGGWGSRDLGYTDERGGGGSTTQVTQMRERKIGTQVTHMTERQRGQGHRLKVNTKCNEPTNSEK